MADRLTVEQRRTMQAWEDQQRAGIVNAQEAGLIGMMPVDQLLLAANALVHGLAHFIAEGRFGALDSERVRQLATSATGVLGIGLAPRPGCAPAEPELEQLASSDSANVRMRCFADDAVRECPGGVASAAQGADVASLGDGSGRAERDGAGEPPRPQRASARRR